MSMTAAESLANPILNSPYDPPEQHFELGPSGPTGTCCSGPPTERVVHPGPGHARRARQAEQDALDFDVTGERREQNTLINDIRREVERWRASNWNGVTPYTRKLLTHWAPDRDRDDPVLFCQREAAETAIFLAEVAGRHGTADYRRRLEPENALHNDGLPRVGLKMATGTGKTVVMAMLIAWQTINKVHDAARRPLRQALPRRHARHHDPRPPRRAAARSARTTTTASATSSRPTCGRRCCRRRSRSSTTTRSCPRTRRRSRASPATPASCCAAASPRSPTPSARRRSMVAARILRAFGAGKGEIVVLNDEAHHCYQDKLLEHPDDDAEKEDKERNREARVWFRGLADLHRKPSASRRSTTSPPRRTT